MPTNPNPGKGKVCDPESGECAHCGDLGLANAWYQRISPCKCQTCHAPPQPDQPKDVKCGSCGQTHPDWRPREKPDHPAQKQCDHSEIANKRRWFSDTLEAFSVPDVVERQANDLIAAERADAARLARREVAGRMHAVCCMCHSESLANEDSPTAPGLTWCHYCCGWFEHRRHPYTDPRCLALRKEVANAD